ncbi:hypothetical protein PPSIR1_17045 [Plesiocystis pacifica SIR-1]|uniref:Lipoprotein n=1 Tax=Plesiocystis pacifica SIR-1 TaxID=391625 RepID=A6GGK2_9BACT|nr:hypothetical protein [Plesiocystis pacifica]EDM75028.1 hypothetical protein PPSIR1_17045 [Plesiocystis pacifica SIR-1]
MRPRVLAIAALLALTSCSTSYRARFHDELPRRDAEQTDRTAPAQPSAAAPFIKVHTHTGEVYVFDQWRFDEAQRVVYGHGMRYSAQREVLERSEFQIAYEQVALVESNTPEKLTHATSLAIMGVAVGAVTGVGIYCGINPKACFGSCPTFYVEDREGALTLRAEGFSSAVAEALEERDVDHLGVVDPLDDPQQGQRFELIMANEALETHFLRSVELLSVARPDPAVEIFHAGGRVRERAILPRFLGVRGRAGPTRCRSAGGDCLDAVAQADALEYASTTDGVDLAAEEHIELEFPDLPAGTKGVVVLRARNTLLDTFLFYQGLAYMGEDVARWILRADREGGDGPLAQLLRGFDEVLGGVEVELWQGGAWVPAGGLYEYGPIAKETQAIELPARARADADDGEPLRLRLRLTRGRWKLDQASLGERVAVPSAVTLEPVALVHSRDGRGQADPEGLATLLDPQRRLISYPGDVWTLDYALPPGSQALFLASEGFYWEWTREDWLAEQSALEAARFFADPRATLRRLAPDFAAMEGELEPVFWKTRIRPVPLEGGVVEGAPQ